MLYGKIGTSLVESTFHIHKVTKSVNTVCVSKWFNFQQSKLVINRSQQDDIFTRDHIRGKANNETDLLSRSFNSHIDYM